MARPDAAEQASTAPAEAASAARGKSPTDAEALRSAAAELRDLAARGTKPRTNAKKAAVLEARAAELEAYPVSVVGIGTRVRVDAKGEAYSKAADESGQPLARRVGGEWMTDSGDPVRPGFAEALEREYQRRQTGERSAPSVKETVQARVDADPEAHISAYEKRFGGTGEYSADNAAELFPEYSASEQARSQNRGAVAKPASWVAYNAFRKRLEVPDVAEHPDVVLTAGGTGSGKSTGIADYRRTGALVYDSTLTDYAGSKRLVDEALKSGRNVVVRYTYREPLDAFRATIERAQKEGAGRPISIKTHAFTHTKAPEVVSRLMEEYRGNPKVRFSFAESAGGELRPAGVEVLRKGDYTGLEGRLTDVFDREYRGQIPGALEEAVSGAAVRRASESAGQALPGVGEKVREQPGGAVPGSPSPRLPQSRARKQPPEVKLRTEAAPAAEPVTRQHIERAFPGARIEALPDELARQEGFNEGHLVHLPRNRKIVVLADGEIAYQPPGAEAHAAGGGGRILGAWYKVGREGVIKLATGEGRETLRHEDFHAAMDLVLNPIERRSVLNRFGDEEAAAEAYARWQPQKNPYRPFVRIRDFFRRIAEHITRRAGTEDVFGRIERGEVWRRKGDAEPLPEQMDGKFRTERDKLREGEVYSPRPGLFRSMVDFLRPVETRIGQEGKKEPGAMRLPWLFPKTREGLRPGKEGTELVRKLTRARDVGEVQAGKRIAELVDSGLMKLDKADRDNLLDVLQGAAEPRNEAVAQAFKAVRGIINEIAGEAASANVKVRESRTLKPGDEVPEGAKLTRGQQERLAAGKKVPIVFRRPFRGRENYYPHVIPDAKLLQSGKIRADVIDNLVRQGVRADKESAAAFLDEWRKFVETGGRAKAVEKYLIDSGQAANPAEAYRLLNVFRKRHIQRQGSLEYARQVDLPFYDPDPGRVLPPFVHATSIRLAQVREFGQSNEAINKLIKRIDDAGGNAIFVRSAVDRMLRLVDEPDTGAARLSRAVRVAQGFKLGLAAIPNVTQGALNTLLKTKDLRDLVAGAKGLSTAEGRRLAMRSGASLEGVIDEMVRYAGGESGALTKFLKATGFTATERANRVFAANAGLNYAQRMLRRLKLNPRDRMARERLEELGLKPDVLLKAGKLDGDAALVAAKKFSDITQFRSGVGDLPFFASSPMGKVVFQFKNYIYGQTRLLHRELIGELRSGRPGEAFKTLLILGIAFPLAGEAIEDLRSWMKGRERDEGLKRYFDDLAATGTLGVLQDLISSGLYGRAAETLAGPTVGEAGETIENLVTAAQSGNVRPLAKQAFRRVPTFGSMLAARLFPPRNKRKGGLKGGLKGRLKGGLKGGLR